MNPRDEKILLTIDKKQKRDYGNLVPFCIIQKSFPWIDGTELTMDLFKLVDSGYLYKIDDPATSCGFWYGLRAPGNRECDRIKHNDLEAKRNRRIQVISSIISVLLGYFLGKFF